MSCTYKYIGNDDTLKGILGTDELSYWQLFDALFSHIDNVPALSNALDILYSASKQEETTTSLNAIKQANLKAQLDFDQFGNTVIDDSENNVYNIQNFLDSPYFDPEQNLYIKFNDDEYVRILKESGMTDSDIAQLKANFKQVGADSYELHFLMNNYYKNSSNTEDWNNHMASWLEGRRKSIEGEIGQYRYNIAAGKMIEKSQRALEFAEKRLSSIGRLVDLLKSGRKLGAAILNSRVGRIRGNKIDSTSTKSVNNIPISTTISRKVTGIKDIILKAHIDNCIVDAEGNISIYQHVVSGENQQAWDYSKKQKFNIELSFLKRMLEENGIHARINLYLVPVKVDYNQDFSIKDVHIQDPQPVSIIDSKDNTANIEDYLDTYYDRPEPVTPNLSKKIETALNNTRRMFLDANISENRISESVSTYISKNYDPVKGTGTIHAIEDDDKYHYSITINGKEYKIKEDTAPKNNKELKEVIKKHITEEENQITNLLESLQKQIRVARHNGQFDFSEFKNMHSVLQTLEKYIMPSKYVNDVPDFEWHIVPNDDLLAAHILLFQNKEGQLDVVSLSTFNLYSVNTHRSNGNNIMNSYIMDNLAGDLYNYNASFGHMEQIKILNILNEILPELSDLNYTLGNINIISTYNNGQNMTANAKELVEQVYSSVIDTTNTYNSDSKIINNFNKVVFTDAYKALINSIKYYLESGYITDANKNYNTFSEAQKALEEASDDTGKRKALQSFLENMWDMRLIKSVRETNNFENFAPYAKAIINIYSAACIEYNKLMGIHVTTQYKPLSTLESDFLKPSASSDSNYRTITSIVKQTTYRANDRVMKAANPIQKFTREFFNSKGYGSLQASTLGDENTLFKNMFVQNDKGDPIMMFKNPYTDSSLSSEEKQFLKKALFEFAKVTYSMQNKKFDFTSCEDTKFIKEISSKEQLRQVPLMRSSTSSFKLKAQQAYETIQGLFGGEATEVFARWQQTLDKEGYSTSMKERLARGVVNPFYANMKGDKNLRDEILQNHPAEYWEMNIPAILYNYINANIMTQEFNKTLILTKSIMWQAKIMAIDAGNYKYLEWLQKQADKYLTVNVFHDSILEDTSKKIFTIINPIKAFTSKMFLMFNVKSAFRDTLEGMQQAFIRSAIKYGSDITPADLAKAYNIVHKGCFTNARDITLLNQLCIKYGLSNLDFANIATGLRTDKSGLSHISEVGMQTMKRPDFLNRMTLFVARCIHDGVWDALSLDENGEIKYDISKDARYKDMFTANPNTDAYKKAKARYLSAVRQYNKEHIENPIGFDPKSENHLPMPYSYAQIEKIKEVANSIYGDYDRGGRAMAENMAIGMAFGQYTTYSNGILANWFAKKRVIESDDIEQETNEKGELLFFTEDGQITTEDTGIPVYRNVPVVVQGIWYTCKDLFNIMLDSNLGDVNKRLDKIKFLLKNSPNDAANIRKAISSLLYAMLTAALIKNIIKPAHDAAQKDLLAGPVGFNETACSALMYIGYKGFDQSTDNFSEIAVVPKYFAGGGSDTQNGMSIPFQSYPTSLVKNLYKFTSDAVDGDFHPGLTVINSVPSLSLFKKASKAYYQEHQNG